MRTALRIVEAMAGAMLATALGCGGEAPSADEGAAGTTQAAAGTGGGATSVAATTGAGASGGGSATGGGSTGPSYPIPDWPTGSPEDHGLDPAGLDAATAVAEGDESYCLLVIRHGVLVWERYFAGTGPSTASPSWSMAKSYSSTLVGIAIDQGDIQSLDQSASDFIPEWKADERAAITIRHLVSMTSGLEWSAFQDYVEMATFSQDHTAFAIGLSPQDPPGSTWTYHNGGVQILEAVFRAATGHTLEEYAEEHLWSKVGMSATWKHDPAGHPTAYANVLATCRDHARLGYLFLHGGKWADEQVVSSDWVKAALTPSQTMNRAYGFLWWLNGETPAEDAMMEAWPGRMVPFAPPDLFAARGFGNQFVDVIPSLDLMVVRFGADPVGSFDIGAMTTDSRFETHDEILKPILDAVVE